MDMNRHFNDIRIPNLSSALDGTVETTGSVVGAVGSDGVVSASGSGVAWESVDSGAQAVGCL